MDDESRTCLSPEAHDDNIKDHILHFLGCLEYRERDSFLNNPEHPLWKKEKEHIRTRRGKQNISSEYDTQGLDMLDNKQHAEELVEEKRKSWQVEFQMELQRIDFLRETLVNDEEEKHLVKNLENSREAWQRSSVYENAMSNKQVRRTKINETRIIITDAKSQVSKSQQRQEKKEKYNVEKDVHAPFVQFEYNEDKHRFTEKNEEEVLGQIWGKFPNQKTTIDNLIHGKKKVSWEG